MNIFHKVKNDVLGGVTAGVVAIPLALAFGIQSGLGAAAGLYCSIAVGFFASLFGGTKTQISGPTGPMTVVAISVVSIGIQSTGSIESALGFIFLTFLLTGMFQIFFGLCRLGSYVKFIPYSVISGFMSGIGVLIILFQMNPFLGSSSEKSIIKAIVNLPSALSSMNWSAFALGISTVFLIYVIPKFTKAIPSTLIALILMTVVSTLLGLDVSIIGSIPEGFSFSHLLSITIPSSLLMLAALKSSITLAALGSIDSLLTSIVADNKTKTRHLSNKELIGQGIGNIASALIGGLPGAGATMRTVVNINAGGKTKLSGIIHSLLLALIILGLGQYASYIPLSVLAGILMTVGLSILDYKGMADLVKAPKGDAAILIIVLLITVFGDLITAVFVGIVLSCVFFMKNSSDIVGKSIQIESAEMLSQKDQFDKELALYKKHHKEIYVKEIDGAMFFGSSFYSKDLMNKISDNMKILIIKMEKVPYIDQTAAYYIEEMIKDLHEKNISILIVGLQQQPSSILASLDVIPKLLPKENIVDTLKDSHSWFQKKLAI